MNCRITYLGTATLILEIGPFRLLTDPALDSASAPHHLDVLGIRRPLVRLVEPAIPAGGIGRTDAVLLSHDQHEDNLDAAGRALLPSAGQVLTTVSGARRLGGNAVGLAPWETRELASAGGERLRVTATPARHGPPGSQPIVGDSTGFMLEWDGQQHGALYISGDTVWFGGITEIGRRFRVSAAVLHIGGAGFRFSGPLRYTFNGAEAARAARAVGARTILPIHYDDWKHFREPRAEAEAAFAAAGFGDRVRWLALGAPTDMAL